MPETLKALVVVLAISIAVYAIFSKQMVLFGVDKDRILIRAKAYLICLVGMFATGNFWLASGVLLLVMHWANKTESNPLALYLVFLLGLPNPSAALSGLGVFGHLLEITPHRFAALLILLPVALKIYRERKTSKKVLATPQKLQILYFGLMFWLTLDVGTFLAVIRVGFVYPVLDAILITYIAANTLTDKVKMWDFMGTLVFMMLVMSAVAIFEGSWKWLLFSGVTAALESSSYGFTPYLLRDETLLRAMGPSGHAIILGYLIMTAVLVVLGSLGRVSSKTTFLILAVLIGGSIATVSRGPWVGVACGVLVLCLVSGSREKLLLGLVASLFFLVPLAVMTEAGRKMVEYLPFFGTIETETIDYRQRLVEIAINVAQQNPFFGAYDFLLRPEMQEMRQGQGIIDIVNTYVSVVLYSGLTGLFFFVGSFVSALFYGLKCINGRGNRRDEMAVASQIVLACLISMMVTIYTVSSIGAVPHFYWAFIGVAVACYTSMYGKKTRSVVRR
jgi:O-antigen ligase